MSVWAMNSNSHNCLSSSSHLREPMVAVRIRHLPFAWFSASGDAVGDLPTFHQIRAQIGWCFPDGFHELGLVIGAIPSVSTDSEIIVRSLTRASAFTEIFDRHATVIGRYVARRLGPHDAEDVVSETFLVAFQKRSSFDQARDSARPWLLGIATRLMKKRQAVEARHWEAVQLGAAAARTDVDITIERAAERADAAQAVRELWPTVAKLSSGDRETLMLYALADLSYEEIAAALSIPVGTVRSRLNRVRRRLDAAWKASTRRDEYLEREGQDDGHYRART
ncbi:RNA polymerase sigma factor [Microbacterium suaedae]|uniref:RNA polymerase sigma factor n=1 Tax=Microbacterium suaedae TaxID=2067813 RepID=UPI0030B81770